MTNNLENVKTIDELTLFEQFILWLNRNKKEYTIATGITYGRRIYQAGRFTFTEISSSEVYIVAEDFFVKVTSFEELLKFAKAIR